MLCYYGQVASKLSCLNLLCRVPSEKALTKCSCQFRNNTPGIRVLSAAKKIHDEFVPSVSTHGILSLHSSINQCFSLEKKNCTSGELKPMCVCVFHKPTTQEKNIVEEGTEREAISQRLKAAQGNIQMPLESCL